MKVSRRELLKSAILLGVGAAGGAAVAKPIVENFELRCGVRPVQANKEYETYRTSPDFVVYAPTDYHDGDNEHFLVCKNRAGDRLLAFWTQATYEGYGDNRIIMSRSYDAIHWDVPIVLAGPTPGDCINRRLYRRVGVDSSGAQASWAFPIVGEASGRIYLFYLRQSPDSDRNPQGCGFLEVITSDDEGDSWTDPFRLPCPKDRYDNPEPRTGKHWIVWQKPLRLKDGTYLAGYTQITSPEVRPEPEYWRRWWAWESRLKFLRFPNLHLEPDSADIDIEFLPEDEKGLEVQHPNFPWSSVEEPSIVTLPDGRLFCIARSWTGNIWWSLSGDSGYSWSPMRVLRYQDNGQPIPHPRSPCPIYQLSNDVYVLLFHNNDVTRGSYDQLKTEWLENQLNGLRFPTYKSIGRFVPANEQPLVFDAPSLFIDNDGAPYGPLMRTDCAIYTSVTEWQGRAVLWYPDRKYFLLGQHLDTDSDG